MIKNVLLIFVLCFLGSCSTFNRSTAEQELVNLHKAQEEAHLTGNAALLTAQMADSVMIIQDGEAARFSKGDIEERFASYFEGVNYRKWETISDPILQVSNDGSLATIILQIHSEAATVRNDSIGEYQSTDWAWMTAYRKENDEWRMYAISSGRK